MTQATLLSDLSIRTTHNDLSILFVFKADGARGLFRGVRGFFISFKFKNCLPICDFNGSAIFAHLNFLPASLFSGSCLSTGLLSNFMYAVVVTAPLKWSLFEKYARFLSGGSVSFV